MSFPLTLWFIPDGPGKFPCPVAVVSSNTVFELKNAILQTKHRVLQATSAASLKLWMVCPPQAPRPLSLPLIRHYSVRPAPRP